MSRELSTIPTGERWEYVVPAYVCAFLPWGALYLFDFISPKWKSVASTRKSGFFHLFTSILPMSYVVYYTHLQRVDGNFQEMMTAIVSILLNLYHVGRTIWGLIQLNQFKKWCLNSFHCLQSLTNIRANYRFESDFDSKLMVNNAIVDNEFTATDLGVGLVLPGFQLRTSYPELCTVRWCAAFLCAFGESWLNDIQHNKFVELFDNCRVPLRYVLRTTFNTGSGSRVDLCSLFQRRERKFVNGAFATDIVPFSLRHTWLGLDIFAWLKTFSPYEIELHNLLSSYPVGKDREVKQGWEEIDNFANRDKITIHRVEAFVIANHLGCDVLDSMQVQYQHVRFPTDFAKSNAWALLLEQFGCQQNDELRDVSWIPNFPWNLLLVPLWNVRCNWNLLQASAHADIRWSVLFKWSERLVVDNATNDCFTYARHVWSLNGEKISQFLSSSSHQHTARRRFLGASLDMVRTFLAEWLLSSNEEIVNWTPSLPRNCFEFTLSDYLFSHRDELFLDVDLVRRFVWECQFALQSELATSQNYHCNLPESEQLVMFFYLSYPLLELVLPDATNNTSVVQCEFVAVPSPQQVVLAVCANQKTGSVKLSLKSAAAIPGDASFDWGKWINSAMGLMKGCDDWLDAKYSNQFHSRTINNVSLSNGFLTLSQHNDNFEYLPGEIQVWTRWPIFDVRVCHFEVSQWLRTAGLLQTSLDSTQIALFDNELSKAYETFDKIRR